jgi:hypothetical protein
MGIDASAFMLREWEMNSRARFAGKARGNLTDDNGDLVGHFNLPVSKCREHRTIQLFVPAAITHRAAREVGIVSKATSERD